MAEERHVSMAQVALAWLLDRPAVTSLILGARTLEQLEDNLAAAEPRLSEEELARLDKVSDPGAADCPYGAPGEAQRSRTIAGGRRPPQRSEQVLTTSPVAGLRTRWLGAGAVPVSTHAVKASNAAR